MVNTQNLTINSNEVFLFGTKFPIEGPIQRTMLTPFPSKVTQGDYSRDDEIVTSSWVQSDWTGGIGIENSVLPRDQDRFFDSSLETRHPQALTLLPKLDFIEISGRPRLPIDYDDRFYYVIGDTLYKWDEVAGTASSAKVFTADPTDIIVFKNQLFVALGAGTDMQVFDGTTWAAVTGFQPSLLVEWVDKLWAMTNSGTFHWSVDGKTTWAAAGTFHRPAGWAQKLLIFFDQVQNPSIHVISRDGVYGYDEEKENFVPTPLTWPTHRGTITAAVWRGDLYCLVGTVVYRFNGQAIQAIGPERDEGLPPEFRGEVTQFGEGHSFYYIGVVAPATQSSDQTAWPYTGSEIEAETVPQITSRTMVLAAENVSLHPIFRDPQAGTELGAVYVSDVQDTYRIWIGTERRFYSMELPRGLFNPLRNPLARYQDSGYLISPWFDGNWPEIDKIALSVKVTSENVDVSSGETISFYIQYDDEDDWTHIGDCSCQASDGRDSGRDIIPLHVTQGGRVFRRCRFRIEMERGSDDSKAPVLRSIALSYMLAPDVLWGYQFTISLAKTYLGNSPRELRDLLEDAAEQKLTGFFFFRDDESDKTVGTRVKISRLQGTEHGGNDWRGKAVVSVLQLQADQNG